MIKRILQRISVIFANNHRGSADQDICVLSEAKPEHVKPHGSGLALRREGLHRNHDHVRDRENPNGRSRVQGFRNSPLQNASRLLRDGRFQIGITGFHDTAFSVSIMARHDASQLAAAIADLPCRVKMVAERNVADGLLAAMHTLDTSDPGRRGIVLVTTGDSSSRDTRIRELAEMAARRRIGIHVICLGPQPEDLTCGPRINTKSALGYGGFRIVETQDQLLCAIRDAFDGLTPAFGMRGTNKAAILVDCSETMVKSYRNTTRIEMVIDSLQEFLRAPLVRSHPLQQPNNKYALSRSTLTALPVVSSFGAVVTLSGCRAQRNLKSCELTKAHSMGDLAVSNASRCDLAIPSRRRV